MAETLAIHGGPPVRERPFSQWPIFGDAERHALVRALDSGQWGKTTGNVTAEFEKRFAEYHEAQHGIAVVNGTAALRIALLAADIDAGDEVIVPPYTFIATASAVVEANATPVFVDLKKETFNIDPDAIEAAVTDRTRAIIPVHFAGLPADMDAIMAIAQRHNLIVIEDACHAHGASYKGRRVGAIGHVGVFSFQSTKNLTSGEGGILLTNDDRLAERCWSIHNCGRHVDRAWYEHFEIGGNYRLSEFQSAILNAQWERFPEQADTRERQGRRLAEQLARLPGVSPQERTADCTRHGYHLFMLRLDPQVIGVSRAAFLKALSAEGIPNSAGYPMPLYRQVMFEERRFGPYAGCPNGPPRYDYRETHCPNCEIICSAQGVWLEQQLMLGSSDDIDDIATAFEKVYANRMAIAAGL
jgi:dTDP-4-amino-4,6-dideoxygalactose transaminase